MPQKTPSLSVLVIDDEPDVGLLIQGFLRRAGYSITSTADAREGIALVGKLRPDIILCDAAMPVMSGPEVIEALKSDPETAQIPIVLMSGHADGHMFAHARWNAFLGKPFTPQELFDSIDSAAAQRVPPKVD